MCAAYESHATAGSVIEKYSESCLAVCRKEVVQLKELQLPDEGELSGELRSVGSEEFESIKRRLRMQVKMDFSAP